MIERDILKNAKYIIAYFKERDKNVTNLMLEKLLYFLEAIYMVMTDEDRLFKEDFAAWNFGPVNEIVYKEYKDFGSMPIFLDEEIKIPKKNEEYVAYLYELFKDYNAYMLVNLSHSKNSPWYKINEKYDFEIPKGEIIPKEETKEWFNTIVEITPNEK